MMQAAVEHGPSWSTLALGAFSVVQSIGLGLMWRMYAKLDQIAEKSTETATTVDSHAREIERLRDRTPHGPSADAQQAMAAFAETARLLMQELREQRAERARSHAA